MIILYNTMLHDTILYPDITQGTIIIITTANTSAISLSALSVS